ncbi:MAG: hypothetical protein ABIF19_07925 [Planctomycetota bacterium]
MRLSLASLVCILSVLLLNSCHSDRGGVEVIVDGDRQFPDFLVGRWKADSGGWEFVFEKDGTISSAMVSLGRARLKPGHITVVPMELGGKGVFEPGPWTVQYSHEQRELIVEISIARFRAELGENVLRGRTRDFFVGSVSPDGQLWPVQRFSYPEYVADTEKYHDYKLAYDPNDNPPENLLFQKVRGTE